MKKHNISNILNNIYLLLTAFYFLLKMIAFILNITIVRLESQVKYETFF